MFHPRTGLKWLRLPVLAAALVVLSSGVAGAGPVKSEKPNFLIVMLDDAPLDNFGWRGDPLQTTPSFDEIVRRSLTFEYGHTMSRCRPSGTRFLTGAPAMDETHNGIWANGTPNSIITDRIWPKLLAEAEEGPYRVFATGKVEYIPETLGLDGEKVPLYWSRDIDETEPIREFLRDVAKTPETPWVVYLRVRTPHEPLVPPQRFLDLIEPKRHLIPIPAAVPESDHEAFLDDEVPRRAMLAWANNKFRKTMFALAEEGHVDDFFVILVSTDNGRANGHVAKGSPYCRGVNTPITIGHVDRRWVAAENRGRSISDLSIDLLDVAATLLDYGQVEVPDSYVGHSLRGILEGTMTTAEWRETYRAVTPGASFTRDVTDFGDPSPVEDLIAVYAVGVETTGQGPKVYRYVKWMRDIESAEDAFEAGVWANFVPFSLWGPKRRFREELFNLTDDPQGTRDLLATRRGPSGALLDIAARLEHHVDVWWREHASEPLPRR